LTQVREMKKILLICLLGALSHLGALSPGSIQITSKATEVERYAAQELAAYIEKSTGRKLPVVSGEALPEKPAFLIGPVLTAKTEGGLPSGMDDNTAIVEKRGKYIVLTGRLPEVRGNLYAVYDYLERQLGVRWFTPEAEIVPQHKEIPADFAPMRTQPAFPMGRAIIRGWLSARFAPEQRSAFCARMRQTGAWLLFRLGEDGKYGFGIHNRPLGHSIPFIIPHKKYFGQHPEWFALMPDGKRCTWSGTRGVKVAHLCLSNKELQKEFTKEAVKYWEDNWKASWHKAGIRNVYLSLSGADNLSYCRCGNCKAEYTKYGHSGQYIRFITPALSELKKRYPEIRFGISAYQHTLEPPRGVDVPENVVVGIAGLHNDNSKPVDHPFNKRSFDALKAWSKLCKEIRYTHYSANYHNFLFPVDNLFILADDYRLLRKMGVISIYDLSSTGGVGIDFEEMRFYVTAKLQADPSRDTLALIREFTDGYYGAAAPFVREYIDFMHKRSVASKMRVTSFYKCPAFFDLGYLERAEKLFADAREAAKNDPVILKRLRKDYLHLVYMDLNWTFLRYTPEQFEKRIAQFESIAAEFKIRHFDEDARVTPGSVVGNARALFSELRKTGGLKTYPPIRYFGFRNLQEIKQPDGQKVLKVLPVNDNWVLQWLCPLFFSLPEKKWDLFVEADVRLRADAGNDAPVFRCGFSDWQCRVVKGKEIRKGYHLYPVLRGISGKKMGCYIFFAALKEPSVEAVYVKSFVVRPSGEAENGK